MDPLQVASPAANAAKSEWRQWLRQRLKSVSEPHKQSEALRQRLFSFLAPLPPANIAIFSALPDEPALLPLLERLPQHHWCLPRCTGETLQFHPCRSTSQLTPGAYGIAEPSASSATIEIAQLDILLCPGLGFDRNGGRLGRGKGFYDRTLAQTRPDALALGIAFREQLVEKLPCDPHDRPMTHSATADGITTPSPG